MVFHRVHEDSARDDEIEARQRAIRNLVEDRIQTAMQTGAFDNLPGKGRPLKLEENPYVPPELRLAYKVLADANFAPDWIELDKKVRTAREELEALQARHLDWLQRQAEEILRNRERSGFKVDDGLRGQNVDKRPPEATPAVQARHKAVRAELEKRLGDINRSIDELNLLVPQLSLQRPRLPLKDILAEFDAACRQVFTGLNL